MVASLVAQAAGFLARPAVQAALVGLPIAFDAVRQLNNSSGSSAENLAGAGGSVAGGVAGGVAGLPVALAMGGSRNPWVRRASMLAPVATAGVGSLLGGGAGRGVAGTISGWGNDPIDQQLRAAQKMYDQETELMARRAEKMVPSQRIELELMARREADRANTMAQLGMQQAYYNSLFGPGPDPSAYRSAGLEQLMGNLGGIG